MRTIYLVKKTPRYHGAPKILRAFETREDAEDLIELMEKADVEGLEVMEIEFEPVKAYSRDRGALQPSRLFNGYNNPSLAELP